MLLTTKSPTKVSSIVWSTEALAEAPTIAIVQASVSPIINAEAVAAVRRGLRRAFWPARLPIEPKARAKNSRAPARNGRASTGLIAVTPSRIASTPPPTK